MRLRRWAARGVGGPSPKWLGAGTAAARRGRSARGALEGHLPRRPAPPPHRRIGYTKANKAVGHPVLVARWHINPTTSPTNELGEDWSVRRSPEAHPAALPARSWPTTSTPAPPRLAPSSGPPVGPRGLAPRRWRAHICSHNCSQLGALRWRPPLPKAVAIVATDSLAAAVGVGARCSTEVASPWARSVPKASTGAGEELPAAPSAAGCTGAGGRRITRWCARASTLIASASAESPATGRCWWRSVRTRSASHVGVAGAGPGARHRVALPIASRHERVDGMLGDERVKRPDAGHPLAEPATGQGTAHGRSPAGDELSPKDCPRVPTRHRPGSPAEGLRRRYSGTALRHDVCRGGVYRCGLGLDHYELRLDRTTERWVAAGSSLARPRGGDTGRRRCGCRAGRVVIGAGAPRQADHRSCRRIVPASRPRRGPHEA